MSLSMNFKYPDQNGVLHNSLQESLEGICDCPDCLETGDFEMSHCVMTGRYSFRCNNCGFYVVSKDIRVFISVLTIVVE